MSETYYLKNQVDSILILKADKVIDAGLSNVVLLNAEGNIIDSSVNINDVFTGDYIDGGVF